MIPPSEQAVIRMEAKLVEARAALVIADQELADASFEAIAATEPDVISCQSLALAAARRARDLAHEQVSATVAALDVARDRQKQAIQNDRAIAHAEQVAAVKGALTDRARHVAQLQHHLAAAVQSYREILKASAAAVRTVLALTGWCSPRHGRPHPRRRARALPYQRRSFCGVWQIQATGVPGSDRRPSLRPGIPARSRRSKARSRARMSMCCGLSPTSPRRRLR